MIRKRILPMLMILAMTAIIGKAVTVLQPVHIIFDEPIKSVCVQPIPWAGYVTITEDEEIQQLINCLNQTTFRSAWTLPDDSPSWEYGRISLTGERGGGVDIEFIPQWNGNLRFHRMFANGKLYVAYNGKELSACIDSVNKLAQQQKEDQTT